MKKIKVLSLCGGIETGILALQNLDIDILEYHTFEILPEAIAVSNYHFPWIIHHGDLNNSDFSQFKNFDLLLAGTCCQSLSKLRADKKEFSNGFQGKSKIFFEAVRALKEINPKWFLFENVIPKNDDDLKTMNKLIGVEGKLINSNIFSAQDRERYYWTNIPLNPLPEKSNLVLKDIMESNVDDKYFIDKPFEIIDINKKICGMTIENNFDICRRIYNPNFKCCTLTCISGGGQYKKVLDNNRVRKLTEIEYERLQGLPDNFTKVKIGNRWLTYSKRCSLCGNGWNLPTIEFILGNLKEL